VVSFVKYAERQLRPGAPAVLLQDLVAVSVVYHAERQLAVGFGKADICGCPPFSFLRGDMG